MLYARYITSVKLTICYTGNINSTPAKKRHARKLLLGFDRPVKGDLNQVELTFPCSSSSQLTSFDLEKASEGMLMPAKPTMTAAAPM